ncbi:MAG: hypothetical protein WD533_09290 [Dehalococcoidia bacterium]
MFILWLLVLLSLAIISGVVAFSRVPAPLASAGRVLLGLFTVLSLVYLFYGAANDFQVF